jgi:hypothetical protein
MSVKDDFDNIVKQRGQCAYKILEYRTHYENGGVSEWKPAISNAFVYENIGKVEFRFSMTALTNQEVKNTEGDDL